MFKKQDEIDEAIVVQALKEIKIPVTFSKLSRHVSDVNISSSRINNALKKLVKRGIVEKVSGERYKLPSRTNFVTGVFEENARGFGFILTEDGDVYISSTNKGGAMNRDLCMAVITGRRRGKREGRIVQVVRRGTTEIVGLVEKKGKKVFMIPLDKRLSRMVLVDDCDECESGEVVVAKITRYPFAADDLIYTKLKERIGLEDQKGTDIEVLIRTHGLPTSFPLKVQKEAQKIAILSEEEYQKRKDLRELFTVTIDGLDAKDFDDAVSCVREGDAYRLWVHIADVSYYVRRGSLLDSEARERSFSAYLVDRVIPMLPFELSAGVCSLKPNEYRLAVTVEMLIDRSGEVIEHKVYESLIKSDFRLTYEEVDHSFEKGSFEDLKVGELMELMKELSILLEEKRFKSGALNFEIPEAKVLLDDEGSPVKVDIRHKTAATTIIEESMIVTNETVARYLYWRGYPCIYRVHERPDIDNLKFIERFLAELEYPYEDILSGHPRSLQKIIKIAAERPEKILVNTLLLRAMKKAKYAPSPSLGHFGLATSLYTHFTSPIRRYPDLIAHRLLKEALKQPNGISKFAAQIGKELSLICEHCSVREREVEAAERDSQELKLYEFMKRNHLGDIFEGIISGVVNSGFFVELSNLAEGFVSFAEMFDDYYEVYPERFEAVGRKTGKVFRVGERVMVKVVSVSVAERKMSLILS